MRRCQCKSLVGAEVEYGIADSCPGPRNDIAAALDLEYVDPRGRSRWSDESFCRADDRRVLEKENVVIETPADAIIGELPLPVERVLVGYATASTISSVFMPSPSRFPLPRPLMAHRRPATPNTMFSASQRMMPMMPKKRSSGAARNPTRIDPTAPRSEITPRCQMLSRWKLRCHPTAPPTPTAAIRPTRSGSGALPR